METFLTDSVMGSLWGLHSAKGVPLASTPDNPPLDIQALPCLWASFLSIVLTFSK